MPSRYSGTGSGIGMRVPPEVSASRIKTGDDQSRGISIRLMKRDAGVRGLTSKKEMITPEASTAVIDLRIAMMRMTKHTVMSLNRRSHRME